MNEKEELPKEKKEPELSGPAKQEALKEEKHEMVQESSEQKIKDLESLLKRLQADFDNFRKYSEKEKQEIVQRANAGVIIRFLPFIDELEHTLKEAKKNNEKEFTAMEMLYKNLMKTLAADGLREMNCNGEGFDPYKHDALKQEESELSEGKIISVLKKGYYINSNVLRHAIVIVSSGKKKTETDEK